MSFRLRADRLTARVQSPECLAASISSVRTLSVQLVVKTTSW